MLDPLRKTCSENSYNRWPTNRWRKCSISLACSVGLEPGSSISYAGGKTPIMYSVHRLSRSAIACLASHSLEAARQSSWALVDDEIHYTKLLTYLCECCQRFSNANHRRFQFWKDMVVDEFQAFNIYAISFASHHWKERYDAGVVAFDLFRNSKPSVLRVARFIARKVCNRYKELTSVTSFHFSTSLRYDASFWCGLEENSLIEQ